MGLDMWIRCKTTKLEYKGATGACSGLFGLAPDDDGMVEIGYWRKAFDQQHLICETIKSYDPKENNCVNMKVEKDEIEIILKEAKRILKTHKFDEDGYDENSEFGSYTFNSKRKWKDTIKFFKKALKVLEMDENAEIYYVQWY